MIFGDNNAAIIEHPVTKQIGDGWQEPPISAFATK
jgi:hypothetical protein